MDEQASALLTLLKKSSASIDPKITAFNSLKANIKHDVVPESAQPTIIECVRIAIASGSAQSLVSVGFNTLSHLIKRLIIQDETRDLFSGHAKLLPALLEKLGDAKETYRNQASHLLADLWVAQPADVEKLIKDGAISSSRVRAKEAGMQWVEKMHTDHGLQFKSFVAPIVGNLNDADGMVRECAKGVLVALFTDSKDAAKADLKRQLAAQDVQSSIASYIVSQFQAPSSFEQPVATTSRTAMSKRAIEARLLETPQEPSLPPSAETTTIEPLYIHTQRELEDMFRDMGPCYEGKESEDNWKARDSNAIKLRRLLKGNAPTGHHAAFMVGIKALLDGILKVVKSLRTTMSSNGCELVQEMARVLGPALDPMVEIMLQGLDGLCSATKHIAAQNGNACVEAILGNVSYSTRLMQHIWNSTGDKNVQPRQFATGWLKTMILKQSRINKSHFEHSGGLDLAEKCVKKSLADANPKVRESARITYWVFADIWPSKGEGIIAELDAKSRALLEKANPASGSSSFTSSVGPASAALNPRAAASTARSTLKDTIAAQKRAALVAKKIPDRPNSAMSTFSPVKHQVSKSMLRPDSRLLSRPDSAMSNSRSTGPSKSGRPVTTTAAAPSIKQGSLMSGPIRRPPRPATADPYAAANRKVIRECTPTQSPAGSPSSLKSKISIPNMHAGHSKSKSTTSAKLPSSVSRPASRLASPKTSPDKKRQSLSHGAIDLEHPNIDFARSTSSIPSPIVQKLGHARQDHHHLEGFRSPILAARRQSTEERPHTGHSQNSLPSMAEEDNFTLVLPSKSGSDISAQAESIKSVAHVELAQPPQLLESEADDSPILIEEADEATQDEESERPVVKGDELQRVNGTDEGKMDHMEVYEDPETRLLQGTESTTLKEPEVVVLEELPVNERNHQVQTPDVHNEVQMQNALNGTERPVSPSKKVASSSVEVSQEQRAELFKLRRLLASGIDRLRARALDAHGFRRLQDMVKNNVHNTELRFAGLLDALLEYIQCSEGELKVSGAKAYGLKSQALSTSRGILVAHKRDEDVRKLYSQAMCTFIFCKASKETASHASVDIDKAMDDVVEHANERSDECIDAVCSIAEEDDGPASNNLHDRTVTSALHGLTKLIKHAKTAGGDVSLGRRRRLGTLAVKFLGNANPDIRRADTEFCVSLYEIYGESQKREFWRLLEAAPETQLNLVAYYLARKGKT